MIPIYVFLVGVCVYALLWRGYELILLALFIDAYFGAGLSIPYYSLYTIALVALTEWLKPSLLIYNR